MVVHMGYKYYYKTKYGLDDIMLVSDDSIYLTGLYFLNSCDENKFSNISKYEEKEITVFKETILWLDIYFSGKNPSFTPKYKINNLTPFRSKVIDIMKNIKYGEVISYGDIANKIAKINDIKRMSSQAVGGAVGFNPICIIVPCHRVVGAKGKLTGYGGGIKNKKILLEIESGRLVI